MGGRDGRGGMVKDMVDGAGGFGSRWLEKWVCCTRTGNVGGNKWQSGLVTMYIRLYQLGDVCIIW